MANDLSEAERVVCFSIAGLPRSGYATVVTSLTHFTPGVASLLTPTYQQQDFTGIVGLLNTILTNLPQAEIDNARTQIFTIWLEVETSEMVVSNAGTEAGTLIRDDTRRENIRRKFTELTGFAIPPGGFYESAKRENSSRITGMGNGDR